MPAAISHAFWSHRKPVATATPISVTIMSEAISIAPPVGEPTTPPPSIVTNIRFDQLRSAVSCNMPMAADHMGSVRVISMSRKAAGPRKDDRLPLWLKNADAILPMALTVVVSPMWISALSRIWGTFL